jgi:hypothetical protein
LTLSGYGAASPPLLAIDIRRTERLFLEEHPHAGVKELNRIEDVS